MAAALDAGRRSCWLALFAAVALANAGPSAVNAPEPVPVSRTDAAPAAIPLVSEFEQAVAPQLRPPPDVVASYATRLRGALDSAGVRIERPQFVALVDRSPKVQALLLLWGSADTVWRLVGAAPVSTGLPGRYEHFAAQGDERDAAHVDRQVQHEIAAADARFELAADVVCVEGEAFARDAVGLRYRRALGVGGEDQQLLGPHVDVAQQQRQHALADAAESHHHEATVEAMHLAQNVHHMLLAEGPLFGAPASHELRSIKGGRSGKVQRVIAPLL